MKKTQFVSLVLGLCFLYSGMSTAYAQSSGLKCDRAQNFCYTNNKRTVIGDMVIFLSDYSELIAVGEIVDVSGTERKIKITKRYGTIDKKTKIKVLLEADVNNLEKMYKVAKKDLPAGAGGSIGLGKLNIGTGAMTFVANGYYEQHWEHGINWVGRGTLFYGSGEASDYNNNLEKVSYSAFGLLFSAGASYKVLRRSLISFRGEVDLGLGYASVSGDGDAPALDKLKSGVVLFPRFELQGIYNGLDKWKPTVDVSYMHLKDANLITIAIGISMGLKKPQFFVPPSPQS